MNKYIIIDNIPFVLHNKYLYSLFPQNINKKIQCPKGAFFIRYISNFDSNQTSEWYYIIKDKIEDINNYTSKVRNQINKGLSLNRIALETDIKKIYLIYKDVNKDYGNKTLSFEKFKDYFDNDFSFPSFNIDYWIVYNNEIPIGYSKVAILEKEMAFYEEIHIIEKYKKTYASYALIHSMNKHYLNDCNLKFITDGSRNLFHPTKIQEFLISKFQFRKAFCQLHISYSFMAKFILILLRNFYVVFKSFNFLFFMKVKALLLQDKINKHTI